jgi:hypothetical protein
MRNMNHNNDNDEKGVALLLSILALLLLSAVAVTMMYMAATESSINSNFKSEETQYFAARAGIQEIRDRMIPGAAPYSINGTTAGPNPPCPGSANCYLPTALPAAGNGGVVYILQGGANPVTAAQVMTPPGPGAPNPLFDDELCHDYTIGGMAQSNAPNVPCTTVPGGVGSGWYTIPPGAAGVSAAPNWNGANPLDWKWTRISLKANNSTAYCVDGTPQPCALGAAMVCWDGVSEKPLTAASCNLMIPTANPVYLVTSLAVSSTGTRRLIQEELAQTPSAGQPGGLFATGTGCGSPLVMHGNMATASFNSATENPPTVPPSNAVNSGGDVGANGSVSVLGSAATVNGNIASTYPASQNLGCPASAVSTSGHPTINSQSVIPTPYTPPTPPAPSPLPPQSACGCTGALAPGSYGNISLSGHSSITLQGGTPGNPTVYNINSLTEAGQSSVTISPVGPVVVNIAGVGQATVLDLSGGGFANNSGIAADLVFNYGGNGAIVMTGGSGAFFVLNAPNASLSLKGNSNFYGQALAANIDVGGTPTFYWDTGANTPPINTNAFYEISMRELSY